MPQSTATADPHVRIVCTDLNAAIAFYTGPLAFRLEMIMPADAPRLAIVSGHGITIRLDIDAEPPEDPPVAVSDLEAGWQLHRAENLGAWVDGRAGMQYRDLIPGRLGGRVIASHIRILDGGPVQDYVHYHRVGFQMIFCRRGWVRVVYEDQGPPFLLHAGDGVLQPATIRHRVLEASPGLEVIEIGCPADHPTFRDHTLVLPTTGLRPDRSFEGQRFVRHIASKAVWQGTPGGTLEYSETGIGHASDGLAIVRVGRAASGMHRARAMQETPHIEESRFVIIFVLEDRLQLHRGAIGQEQLAAGDLCLIPPGSAFRPEPSELGQWLEVALRVDH